MFKLSLSAKVAFAQLAQMVVFMSAMVFILGSTSNLFDRTALISERLEPATSGLARIDSQIGTAMSMLDSGRHENLRKADRYLVRHRPVRKLRNVTHEELTKLAAAPELGQEAKNRIQNAFRLLTKPSGENPAPVDSEATIDGTRIRMTAAIQDQVNSKKAATELFERLRVIKIPVSQAARELAAAVREADHDLAMKRSTLWTAILVVTSTTLALSILFMVLAIHSTRHIREITLAVRRLAAGDLSHLKLRSSREVEETADAINQLAEALRARQDANAVEKEREVRTERLAVVGRMASAVAHEIRNPLNSISLNIDVLADMLESPDKYEKNRAEIIGTVQREIDRLNGITEDYLQFGRMPKAMIGPCNVSAVTQETCDFMSGEFQERGVDVSVESFDRTVYVLSDEGQLRQALVNILRNAVEAMPDGGPIAIRISPTGDDSLLLEIRDSGQGIPAAQMNRLFEPFATTKQGGTGLGLALVQQVITESGGKVQVESKEGTGTTIMLTLKRVR